MKSPPSQTVEALIKLLQEDDDAEVRKAVIVGLGKLNDSRAIAPLSRFLREQNQLGFTTNNHLVKDALIEIGTPEAFQALKDAVAKGWL